MQQVLSVPSQFGDGHAKNFSMAWLPMGRYRLTPLYDVMSIWPLEGNGPSQFSRHEAKLAMALSGKSRHDHFKTIQRRHLNAMAQKCHYGPDAENIIQRVLAATPGVVDRIAARLPAHFPAAVSSRILEGLARSAKALRGMPPV